MVTNNDAGFTLELNLLSSQVCAVPLGPVQRQRSLRPDQIQEAVPVRRNRGRGDETSESVHDLKFLNKHSQHFRTVCHFLK